jgi:hypothetical protein
MQNCFHVARKNVRTLISQMLKGQFHEMDIFFEGLNILISTSCVCADGFQGLSKAFTTLYNS